MLPLSFQLAPAFLSNLKKKTKQNIQEGTGFQGNGLGMLQLGKGVGDRVERKPCPQRGTEILVKATSQRYGPTKRQT